MRECRFIAVTPRFERISKSNYAYQLIRAGQGAGNRACHIFHPAPFRIIFICLLVVSSKEKSDMILSLLAVLANPPETGGVGALRT